DGRAGRGEQERDNDQTLLPGGQARPPADGGGFGLAEEGGAHLVELGRGPLHAEAHGVVDEAGGLGGGDDALPDDVHDLLDGHARGGRELDGDGRELLAPLDLLLGQAGDDLDDRVEGDDLAAGGGDRDAGELLLVFEAPALGNDDEVHGVGGEAEV